MTPRGADGAMRPDSVAALLGHGVSANLAARLLASRRLAARLDGVLQQRLGILPALDAAQARALALDMQGWAALQRQAGAVWHGHVIAAVVDGPGLRALVAEIGEELRALALRGHAMRGRELGLSLPVGAAAATDIAAAIPGAGARCLAAWCAAQPGSLRARIALRLSGNVLGDVPAAPGPSGGEIVAWLLSLPA